MRWLPALGLAAVLVVGVVSLPLPAVASAQTTDGTGPMEGPGAFNDSQWTITVYENGSARWTHRYNQRLRNETEVERFRTYADRFTSEETPFYTGFRERATALTEDGTNATGRTMTARGFSRDARVSSRPSPTGIVETSFLWTNFSATDDGEIAVGDVFDNGLFLSSGMSLAIEAGPDLAIAWDSVAPTPAASTNGSAGGNDSVTWFGDRQFATGHPRVVFVQQSNGVVGGSSAFDGAIVWLAAAFAIAAILGAVVVRRVRRFPFGESEAATTGERTAETTASDATDVADEPSSTVVVDSAVPDEELRSDEEVVRSLLDDNEGRMRQVEIVEETGWSKSKVSMLLSGMAESGDLSKLRVGRENIVSLDGHEPEVAGSPFDEE